MARRAPAVAEEARRRFVGAIAAEEGQIDQRRDAQPHVVEPDEDAQPVVGEQAEKNRQAELAEVVRLGRIGRHARRSCAPRRPDCTMSDRATGAGRS